MVAAASATSMNIGALHRAKVDGFFAADEDASAGSNCEYLALVVGVILQWSLKVTGCRSP